MSLKKQQKLSTMCFRDCVINFMGCVCSVCVTCVLSREEERREGEARGEKGHLTAEHGQEKLLCYPAYPLMVVNSWSLCHSFSRAQEHCTGHLCPLPSPVPGPWWMHSCLSLNNIE